MSILVIAEKPSVGINIASVLGANKRKDGYLEGGGYIVSWCVGHLVTLADASVYGNYQKWQLEDLPILPDKWQTVVAKDKQKQFGILCKLMKRKEATSLVCATDAGREGELIFRWVYEQAGCKKPFKRLWISSMEESAIRAGFDTLKDSSKYNNLYQSALCRARADWIVGINATRLYSKLHNKTLSVGRVQSPTLAMIVERGEKIAGFVKEKYHHVNLKLDNEIVARSERIFDAQEAEAIRATTEGKQAVCTSVTREQKSITPPKLFDLTTLQRQANRLFGYTAKQTLDTAQTLYEKKLLTYPRTDSCYLTSDSKTGISELVESAASLLGVKDDFSVNTAAVINDAKVSDHHAIVLTPTASATELSALSEPERNILHTVAARLICALEDKHTFEAVTAEFSCAGTVFSAKGKSITGEGWKKSETLINKTLNLGGKVDGASAQGSGNSDGSSNNGDDSAAGRNDTDSNNGIADSPTTTLPPLTKDQAFNNTNATISEHFTSPPKFYTEDTLLAAMESAGVADTTAAAERKGLGTPATRASVIENLTYRKFIKRQGKQLIATDEGIALIQILPKELKTPELTAQWENTLTLIAQGKASDKDFMDGICEMTTAIVKAAQQGKPERSHT